MLMGSLLAFQSLAILCPLSLVSLEFQLEGRVRPSASKVASFWINPETTCQKASRPEPALFNLKWTERLESRDTVSALCM